MYQPWSPSQGYSFEITFSFSFSFQIVNVQVKIQFDSGKIYFWVNKVSLQSELNDCLYLGRFSNHSLAVKFLAHFLRFLYEAFDRYRRWTISIKLQITRLNNKARAKIVVLKNLYYASEQMVKNVLQYSLNQKRTTWFNFYCLLSTY